MSTAVEPEPAALVGVPEQSDAGADDDPAKAAPPELWDTGELDLSALSDPDSGLAGSSSLSGADAPLTSEPPLADSTPLTAEQPLDNQLPLTAEPTGSALQTDDRGAQEMPDVA